MTTLAVVRRNHVVGIALLLLGLGGHLASAYVIRALPHAFAHHIEGFLLLTMATALVLLALGWFFWRGRHDITLLLLGISQFVAGWAIFVLTITKVIF